MKKIRKSSCLPVRSRRPPPLSGEQTMKILITIIFDVEIEGRAKLDNEEISRILFENILTEKSSILSEDVDGTSDWSILIDSIDRKLEDNENAT